jgi:hypothetical protein
VRIEEKINFEKHCFMKFVKILQWWMLSRIVFLERSRSCHEAATDDF